MRENPALRTWMQGGLDYILLQNLNTDAIRTIGCVLGQSIALDYYVRQVSFLSNPTIELYDKALSCIDNLSTFSFYSSLG